MKYVISIGSNDVDAVRRVLLAIDYLRSVLKDFRQSSVYSTPSTKCDGTYYKNAVVAGKSSLTIEEISSLCKAYEHREGRVRKPDANVVIDLDVVMCDDDILRPRDAAQEYFTIGFGELSR